MIGLRSLITSSCEADRRLWSCPLRGFARLGFAHRHLTESEPQEIEPDVSLIGSQGMGNPRYFLAHVLELFYLRIDNDKVICIPNESRFFDHMTPALSSASIP